MEIGFKLTITISTINAKCRCNNYNHMLNINIWKPTFVFFISEGYLFILCKEG